MTDYFEQPAAPAPRGGLLAYAHDHKWYEVSAELNANGTWSSLWACERCPDVAIGGNVGPIPPGYCRCGWVQQEWPREKCEDCKRPLISKEFVS